MLVGFGLVLVGGDSCCCLVLVGAIWCCLVLVGTSAEMLIMWCVLFGAVGVGLVVFAVVWCWFGGVWCWFGVDRCWFGVG